MDQYITLYADASWCPQSNIAGWAVWIKYGDGRKIEKGGFEREVFNSGIAELIAIYRGMEIIRDQVRPVRNIIVAVTDCQAAIDNLQGIYSRKSKHPFRRVADSIHELVPATCSLRVKKVKGHSRNDGARSMVNNLVDKNARKQLKLARNNSYVTC